MDSAGKRAKFQMDSEKTNSDSSESGEPHRYPASASAEGAARHAFEDLRPPLSVCQDSGASEGSSSVLTNHCGSATRVPDFGCYSQQAGVADVTASDRGAEELGASLRDNDNSQGTRSSGSAFRPNFGPGEELGFSKVIAAVGSWVAAAFEAYEDEDENGNDAEGDLDNRGEGVLFGSVSLDAELKGGKPVGSTDLKERAGSLLDTHQLGEPGACSPAEGTRSRQPSSLGGGPEDQPRVVLHLCGHPEPILWRPGDPALELEEDDKQPDLSGGTLAEESSKGLLQVPSVFPEDRGPVEESVPSSSLNQMAQDVELWLLHAESGSLEPEADDSVCSSDSSDELNGERLLDFSRVSAYLVGKTSGAGMEPDRGEGVTSVESLVQLPNTGAGSRIEGLSGSSDALTCQENGDSTGEICLVHATEPPNLAAPQAADLSTSNIRSVPLASAADRPAPLWFAGKEARGVGTLELPARHDHRLSPVDEPKGAVATGATFSDRAESAPCFAGSSLLKPKEGARNSEHPSTAANQAKKQTLEGLAIFGQGGSVSGDAVKRGHRPGSELTSEEAAEKEASLRSLGNRIWAFFGGGGAAQDASAGGEVPASADAVEETIPFEDPAVVQRDDHRTYPNETQHLFGSIKLQPLFQALNPQQQKYLASLMRRELVAPSVCLAEEGGEPVLIWCSSGELDVTQAGFFGTSVVRTLTPGEFFGVEEMLAGERLKCSVTSRASAGECVVWTLDKELFQDSMRDMLAKRMAFVPVAQSFFHMVPLVRDLPEEQIAALAKACKVERFAEGQTVFKMGFHGDMLCFIYKGEAITQKPQDDGGFLELARQGRGEYFGEMALIRNTRRTASVVAGKELVLLCLDKESFERLLAPLKEKMAAKAASSYKRQDDAPLTKTESKLAAGPSAASVPGSREAGEALVRKRTRKSSLALLNYSKIRDQEKQAEDGQDQVSGAKPTARWHLAQEPESIHEPPPLTATGSRSCLKLDKQPSRGRVRKSPVRFDEESLLPSDTSSDEG